MSETKMSSADVDKRSKKDGSRDIEQIDDDDDEETRMRDRLLARRAEQLKALIEAEPADEAGSQSSSKKSHHHHHHKRKKRRHGSLEEEESGSRARSSERLPSVVSAVSAVSVVVQAHDSFVEEEGLNIKPPQAISTSGSSYKRQKKRSREERSPDYRPDRGERRYDKHQPSNYDSERKQRERADEGWASWKKSLDRPYKYGRGSHVSYGNDMYSRPRSPPAKSSGRHGYRQRDDRTSRSPSASNRWLPSTKAPSADRSRSHTTTDYLQSGRDEKRKRDERHVVPEPSEGLSAKRSRKEVEGVAKTTAASTGLALASVVTTDFSPEATPTMDEMDDEDLKKSRLGDESKERKRSPGDQPSSRPAADTITPHSAGGSESTGEKSDRSRGSMESGEHRSDADDAEEKEQGKEEMKKAKYSKFESSSSESEDESDAEQANYKGGHESEESDLEEEEVAGHEKQGMTATGAEAGIDLLEHDVSPVPESTEPDLPIYYPALMGCRSVEEFHSLNRIEEGTYGVVYRAKEKRTDEIVALKRLKMEKEKEGFPITSLREINMLLKAGKHPNIVNVREIVVGSNMDKIYLVMDYVEHDLKSLMETMKQPFLIGEVKTLLKQILAGVKKLHENWILHRDLKTSNLLLSHKGILKIADFGLAREYGSPLKPYTPIVVTLWYRAPELLLGIKEYSTPIDVWSVGCIFAEILTLKPLFTGKSEIEQLNKIFMVLGTPNDTIWPGYSELPGVKRIQFADVKFNYLRKHFGPTLSGKGFELMKRLLTYDPEKRITAAEALKDAWFDEEPRPVKPDMFPTWPAKSEQSKGPRKGAASPKPPSGGKQFPQGDSDKDYLATLKGRSAAVGGFSLKFDAPKF